MNTKKKNVCRNTVNTMFTVLQCVYKVSLQDVSNSPETGRFINAFSSLEGLEIGSGTRW